MANFIILNTLVILNAYLFVKWMRFRSRVDFIIAIFLTVLAQIIFTQLILGVLGLLRLEILLIIEAVFLVFNYLLFGRIRPDFDKKSDAIFIPGSVILMLGLSVFLGFFTVQAWNVLINPPMRADALSYHLTYPVAWLKNGNLNTPFIPSATGVFEALTVTTNYFPINGELIFLWLMLPLKNALFANFAQAPFYVVAILAMYSLLKKFDLPGHTSLLVALAWILMPNIFKHLKEGAYIDMVCAAIFLVLLNCLLYLKKDFNLRNALLSGLVGGIFLGLKTLNLFWMAALVPLIIYIIFIGIREKGYKTVIKYLSLAGLIFILFSAYPYIRNYIMTKNIFFPVRIELFGHTIMPGYISSKEFANFSYPAGDFSIRNLLFSEGLGFQLFAFIIPGTFLPLFLTLLNKRKINAAYLSVYLIPLLMFVFIFFVIKAYWTRYMYSYFAAGFIAWAIFLSKTKKGSRYIFIASLLCFLSSMPELARKQYLVYSMILTLGIFLIMLYAKFSGKKFGLAKLCIPRPVKITVVSALLVFSLFALNHKYEKEQYLRYCKFYKEKDAAYAWKWLDDNTGNGRRVAYVGWPETYPLFGSGLKNDVFYVSINEKPVSLVDFGKEGEYRKERSYEAWLRNLRGSRVDYLFIYQDHYKPIFPVEDEWAQLHPEAMVLVFSNPKVRIYALK